MLQYVIPCSASKHIGQRSIGKSCFCFDLFHWFSGSKFRSKLRNNFVGEHCASMSRAAIVGNNITCASLVPSIPAICARGIEPQMGRIAAGRIVGGFATRQIDVVMQFISYTMSKILGLPIDFPDNPIALEGPTALPWPTLMRPFDLDLFPESLGKRTCFSGQTRAGLRHPEIIPCPC